MIGASDGGQPSGLGLLNPTGLNLTVSDLSSELARNPIGGRRTDSRQGTCHRLFRTGLRPEEVEKDQIGEGEEEEEDGYSAPHASGPHQLFAQPEDHRPAENYQTANGQSNPIFAIGGEGPQDCVGDDRSPVIAPN
jgi:hypothetical protein